MATFVAVLIRPIPPIAIPTTTEQPPREHPQTPEETAAAAVVPTSTSFVPAAAAEDYIRLHDRVCVCVCASVVASYLPVPSAPLAGRDFSHRDLDPPPPLVARSMSVARRLASARAPAVYDGFDAIPRRLVASRPAIAPASLAAGVRGGPAVGVVVPVVVRRA